MGSAGSEALAEPVSAVRRVKKESGKKNVPYEPAKNVPYEPAKNVPYKPPSFTKKQPPPTGEAREVAEPPAAEKLQPAPEPATKSLSEGVFAFFRGEGSQGDDPK